MKIRNTVAALMLAVGTAGATSMAQAARLEFDIGAAPPAPRVEVVPVPRAGYIYEQGHYAWDGTQYIWTDGHWIQERPGHVWQPYVFERRGDTYHFRAGHWDDD